MFLKYATSNFKIIMTFSLLLIVQLLYSQNNKIDSLTIVLQNHKAKDTTRVGILYQMAFSTFYSDEEAAKKYIQEAEQLSNSLNYPKGKADVLQMKGILESRKSNYANSDTYFTKALEIYSKLKDEKGISSINNALGINYYKQALLDEALVYFNKSIAYNEKTNNKFNLISGLLNTGNIYADIGEYTKAINNYQEVIKLSKEVGHKLGLNYAQNNLGNVYESQGNYLKAMSLFKNVLYEKEIEKDTLGMANTLNSLGIIYQKRGDFQEAIKTHEKSFEYAEDIGSKSLIATNRTNIGNIYLGLKKYDLAKSHYQEALKITRSINDKNEESICLSNLGTLYLQTDAIPMAQNYFMQSVALCKAIDNKEQLAYSYVGLGETYYKASNYKEAIQFLELGKSLAQQIDILEPQKDATKLLSEIYKNNRNFKLAFENHELFKRVSDSLLNKENIKKIAAIEYEYKYKKELDDAAERETKLTKTVETTSKDLEKSQRNLLLGIITFLMVALVLGSIIFFLKLRNSKAKTQNIITEQKLLRTQMTPHFIFNSLSVLQGMILNKEESKSVSYLSKFSKLLRITLENSRDKRVSLSQELEAVENYLSLQKIENEKIIFQLNVDDAIETNTIEVPPMLIQPFVENAIEHAFKHQNENCIIEINLKLVDSKLICVILDNGMGIDSSERNLNQNKKSLATKITKERLAYLSKDFKMNASIAIEDRSEYDAQGTQVTIQMPYTKTIQ